MILASKYFKYPFGFYKYFQVSSSKYFYSSVSNPSASSKVIKVPANIYSLEGRYATALYTAAMKTGGENQLENVKKELMTIYQFISKDGRLAHLFKDPTQSRDEKKKALSLIIGKLLLPSSSSSSVQSSESGKKSSSLVVNLLQCMAENGRLNELDRVVMSFEELMKAHKKEVPVTIITSMELDQNTIKKLQERIHQQFLLSDQVPLFKNKIDSNILGGMIVHIADRTIDMSVSSKVNHINQLLDQSM